MNVNRRRFGTFVAGAVGSFAAGPKVAAPRPQTPAPLARAAARLSPAIVTRIRIFYPPNYNANGPQAFPQSNMVVLVDTDAGITGIGQGGSPDTVRNVARSVIGKNAFDSEMIWQAAFMDGFYSPGKERLHALGAIDLALWDIKGKALNAPLYQLFGGKAREHLELYATSGLPQGLVPPEEAAAMGLKERAAATMKAGYRVYRVDGGILPSTGRAGGGATGGAAAGGRGGGPSTPLGAGGRGGGRGGSIFDSRSRIRQIIQAVEQIREGVGPDGNWMIDLHQKFDFHEAVEVCRLMEPYRPFCVEDPVREEQFRTQIPKLRLLTTVPLAPGEEWGTRAEFSPLVEQRDIDFARASLPNVGGITEMLKIMAVCDTHKVGIVPHFTGPIATAGHMHTMMAFPGQVLVEYNQGERPVPYMPEFLECRNGKVWPNDRPGLGVSVDEKQLTFIEAMTEGAPGITHRRPDGSLTHW
jgi:L-alanine-DL-glutamate epimerase-like enolase superfamily enzyme